MKDSDAHPLQKKEEEAIAFFDAVLERFSRALHTNGNGEVVRDYVIGERRIRMRFAGPALVPYFTPALDHLRTPDTRKPDLTLCLWDSASTDVPMLPPPWAREEFEHQGEIFEFNTHRMCTLFQPGEDTLNLLDQARNIGILWRRDNKRIPYYTTGSPLRSLFHWWMSRNGRQFIHGAAVGTPDCGALIVGKGGSGKSTTALSCLDSKLVFAGDDYVLLGMDGQPYIYSLYSSAKLNFDQIRRFPKLEPLAFNKNPSEEDKVLVLLHEHLPRKIARGFPAKAILVPRITGKTETTITKATPVAALAAIAPSTMFQLTRGRERTFARLADFVKRVPAYFLDCGTVIEEIPRHIERFLKGLAPS